MSERDTLTQPNTRSQEKAPTAPSPLESQHRAADFTSLAGPGARSHDGEARPSEDFLLAELLVHRRITISKHTNSERLYGEDEKARLVCSVGQDNACAS